MPKTTNRTMRISTTKRVAVQASLVLSSGRLRPFAFGFSPAALGKGRLRPASVRFMAAAAASADIRHVNKAEMTEIVGEYESLGRKGSNYCIIDVRNPEEVAYTGSLVPGVPTMPLPIIMERNAFALDSEDFEEQFGFAKPTPDETIVFSCASGIRSVYACQHAAPNGYTSLVNYVGGANEWFN